MTHVAITLLAVVLAAAPVHAHAKGNGGHGYDDRDDDYHYRDRRDYHDYRDYRDYRDHRPRGRPHQQHHHHYYRSKKRSNEGAYLLGGSVIGSVLTHVLQPPRAQYAPAPAVVQHASPYGRRLLKDTYGNCFERRGDGAGEVRIPLPEWECAW